MLPVYDSNTFRRADENCEKKYKIPTVLLMEHAGLQVAQSIASRFGSLGKKAFGLILCGPGNNGADAMVVARLLFQKGMSFKIWIAPLAKGTSLWKLQVDIVRRILPESMFLKQASLKHLNCDWIVDGLFGTGLDRPLKEPYSRLIQQANQMTSYRVSIDVPSGLNSDTGYPAPNSPVFSAHLTLTFENLKMGLVTGNAANYTGVIQVVPIGIPTDAFPKTTHYCMDETDARTWLPKRPVSSHKGTFGHVSVYVGSVQKVGASLLAAQSALHAGAGLVSLMAPHSMHRLIRPQVPSAIMISENLPERTSAWVIGPGLELIEGEEKERLLTLIAKFEGTLVIDAGALGFWQENVKSFSKNLKLLSKVILTPHPKEASRLLDWELACVEADRYGATTQLIKELKSTVILKGKGTVIGQGNRRLIVTQGSSVLAKGGSGDLLSGAIAALAAQGADVFEAGALGCFLLGKSSEIFEQERGECRTSSVEILPKVYYSKVFHELENTF